MKHQFLVKIESDLPTPVLGMRLAGALVECGIVLIPGTSQILEVKEAIAYDLLAEEIIDTAEQFLEDQKDNTDLWVVCRMDTKPFKVHKDFPWVTVVECQSMEEAYGVLEKIRNNIDPGGVERGILHRRTARSGRTKGRSRDGTGEEHDDRYLRGRRL